MYACVRECVHACVRVCACVRACVCVCAVWDVDYGCLQFVFELMLVLVTACQSCVYPSASSFGQTPLHFIPYLSLLTSKLVAICMLSETGIQISPLTTTPPAFDKIQMQGARRRGAQARACALKARASLLTAQFVETLLLVRTGLNDNPA